MAQTEYLSTSAMRATSCSMDLASSVLGFDIMEIWSELEDGTLRCTFVHADTRIYESYPNIITGHYPLHKREHKLSPRLCEMARKSPNRCHWRVMDLPSCLSTLPPEMVPVYQGLAFPLKTEMAYQLQVDPEDGYVTGACFIVAFSVQVVRFRPSKLKFLSGVAVAIFVAAFDLDEDADENEKAIDSISELDHKEFRGRLLGEEVLDKIHLSTRMTQIASAESAAVLAAAQTAATPSVVSPTTPQQSTQALQQPQQAPQASDLSPERGTETRVLPSPAVDAAAAPLPPKNAFAMSKSTPRRPVHSFTFPIAEVPIKQLVSDTMKLGSFLGVRHIADGSNSNIFTATLSGTSVIIKMIKENMERDPVANQEFDLEHETLLRVHHRNIIRLLGAGKAPRRFVVLEHLQGGSLSAMLAQNQQGSSNKLQRLLFHKPMFTYRNLLTNAKAIAEALHYLHYECYPGATIIHRDLKPDNVAFTKDGVVKLLDLGLCTWVRTRVNSSDAYRMSGCTGTLRYMAPEVIQRKPYSEKADVYSFGIMLWQMAREKVPFKGYNKDEFVAHVVENQQRPKLDKSWPVGFSNLLQESWAADPEARPAFSAVVSALGLLLRQAGASEEEVRVQVGSSVPEKTKDETVGEENAGEEKGMEKAKRKGRVLTQSDKSAATSTWF